MNFKNFINLTFSLSILFTTFIFITISSCDKSEFYFQDDKLSSKSTSNESFFVEKGILHFKNEDDYLTSAFEVMNYSVPKFRKWEKDLGFVSLQTIIDIANKELSNVCNEFQFNTWMKKYDDLFSNDQNEIKQKINDNFALCFSNREGEFYIGKGFGKVFPDKTIFIKDGDKKKIIKALNLEESNPEIGILIEKQLPYDTILLRNGCPTTSEERWKGKKGVKLVFQTERNLDYISGLYYTEIWVVLHAKSKNWLGKVKNDDADLKVMELEYSVTDNYNREQKLVLATSGPPYSTHVPRIRHTINCLDYTSYQNYQTPKFNISKAKGTSNYLDWNKYAVVCCGVPSFQCPATDG